MKITYNLRESIGVLLAGEPCILTFWKDGDLHKYEGTCHENVAHFPLLPYSTVPPDYWVARERRAAA